MRGLFPSTAAGAATFLGALLVLSGKKPPVRTLALILGGAAGVMLSVVLLELLPAALRTGNLPQAGLGFLGGLYFFFGLGRFFRLPLPGDVLSGYRRLGYLIALGIAAHDLPEGVAISGAYSAGSHLGLKLALALALHNIPEGIAAATPLSLGGLGRKKIIALALVVSSFTPLGTLLGNFLLSFSPGSLSFLLSFAAGAMTYLVKDELLPAAQLQHPQHAWLGFGAGYLLIWGASFLR